MTRSLVIGSRLEASSDVAAAGSYIGLSELAKSSTVERTAAARNQQGVGEITMGLRTPEQYKESLRDGRAVYLRGEKVADVTKDPVIGIAVEHACIDYRMTEEPKRDATTDGE